MAGDTNLLLKSNLKQLRLPTMAAEFEKLAREGPAPTRVTSSTCCV